MTKEEKDEALVQASYRFLKAASDLNEKAVIILPGLMQRDVDRAVVIANWNPTDRDAAWCAVGLLGPLVEDNHAIKCATIASLMGQEEAERCAKCERRGLAPPLQDQFEDGPDDGPEEMH